MSMIFDNAIGWALFHSRGGWKNTLGFAGVYLVFIGGGIVVTVLSAGSSASNVYTAWTTGLLVLQALILVLYAAIRIAASVRQDLTSKMIESHRLMPVPTWHAVAGYIGGGAGQPLVLAAVNVVLGLATTAGAGISVERWVVANLILFLFSVFIWTLVTLVAFVMRRGPGMIFVFIAMGWMNGAGLGLLLPGLFVLASPLIGHTIFQMRASANDLSWIYGVSIAGQLLVAAIFFSAAARKYAQDDAIALPATSGLVMLGVWAGLSIVGVIGWEEFHQTNMFGQSSIDPRAQIVASVVAGMVLAIVPLMAAARADGEWRRRRARDPEAVQQGLIRRPLPMLLVAFLGTLFLTFLAWAPDGLTKRSLFPPQVTWVQSTQPAMAGGVQTYRPFVQHSTLVPKTEAAVHLARVGVTAPTVLAFLICSGYLLRILFRRGTVRKPFLLIAMWLFLTWLGPMLVDVIRHSLTDDRNDPVLQIAATFSPVGLLTELWQDGAPYLNAGLLWQGALAVGAMLLFYATARRQKPSGIQGDSGGVSVPLTV